MISSKWNALKYCLLHSCLSQFLQSQIAGWSWMFQFAKNMRCIQSILYCMTTLSSSVVSHQLLGHFHSWDLSWQVYLSYIVLQKIFFLNLIMPSPILWCLGEFTWPLIALLSRIGLILCNLYLKCPSESLSLVVI